MVAAEPFIFGIPLIARQAAGNWRRVELLLSLTLASLHGQRDRDFAVVIAGHDRPRICGDDLRLTFLAASWPAEPIRADNRDSGRKKYEIQQHVLATGGGLLMFLDADDWVDVGLVAAARAAISPRHVGGLIARGMATDLRDLRKVPIPRPGLFAGGFHRLCGSSTIARLIPDHPDPLRRNPHRTLHEHYRWIEVARAYRLPIARLPVLGNYVVNTCENHSEHHGPYADWRRSLSERIGATGEPLDEAFAVRFGLSLASIQAASAQLSRASAAAGRGRPR